MQSRNTLKQRGIPFDDAPPEKSGGPKAEFGTVTASTKHRLFNSDTLPSAVGVDALLIPVVVSQEWTACCDHSLSKIKVHRSCENCSTMKSAL